MSNFYKTNNKVISEEYKIDNTLRIGTMYIARNKNGELWLYTRKPHKNGNDVWEVTTGFVSSPKDCGVNLDEKLFPGVKWEDDAPKKVKLSIEEESEI